MTASSASARLHPVILSGGSGTRLWPMSRALFPKQFMPLVGGDSLLVATANRVAGPGFAPPMVVCNEEHRFAVAEQLRQAARDGQVTPPAAIVLEPVARSTAPAVAVAALHLARTDPEAVLLVLPADHAIADVSAFHGAIDRAAAAARAGHLVTFGITPQGPETGYGYIRRGAPAAGLDGVHRVDAFVEKPDQATAERYVGDGHHDWNSGMFVFKAGRYLAELDRLAPGMVDACRAALAAAGADLDFLRLGRDAFAACPGESVDRAVMERTDDAMVVPVDMGWSDVGSWSSLLEAGPRDRDGNTTVGDVVALDCQGSYLRGDGRLVAALGLSDIILVATDDAVLAAPTNRAQDVRELVEALRAAGRPEAVSASVAYRPWGMYRSLGAGERFQVKSLMVDPGARLSLQSHRHRAEHWVVVRGRARVTRDDQTIDLAENQSTYIPAGCRHRLENPTDQPLWIIEVQSGDYLAEDDIIRHDDAYGRAETSA